MGACFYVMFVVETHRHSWKFRFIISMLSNGLLPIVWFSHALQNELKGMYNTFCKGDPFEVRISHKIWAASWQNQQNGCAPSEDSDQPGHPPSLIRDFTVRMMKAWVPSYPLSAQRRLWSDWADAKTQISLDIRPVWSETSLSAWWKLGSLVTHWAHSEDSD